MAEATSYDNLYWRLLKVGIRAKHGLTNLADQYGLSPMQVYTLCSLAADTPVPMSTISGMLACDASTVTGLIDKLSRQGYIERRESSTDRRVKIISITPPGIKVRSQILEALPSYQPNDLKNLTATEKEQLSRLLDKALQAPVELHPDSSTTPRSHKPSSV